MAEFCSIAGCKGTMRSKGYCYAHWRRWKRHGDPLAGRPSLQVQREQRCKHGDCVDLVFSSGYCQMHYTRVQRHGDPDFVHKRWARGECSVDGCARSAVKRGWCECHYSRWRLTGTTDAPPRRAKLLVKNHYGYILRLVDDHPASSQGRVPEHRWIVEQQLGRYLLPEETVHHLNGVRGDNRLENLELWSSSHPSGQRVADKLKWAKEILSLYEVAPGRRSASFGRIGGGGPTKRPHA